MHIGSYIYGVLLIVFTILQNLHVGWGRASLRLLYINMAANTDKSYDFLFKIVLLGEDYVGKTCIFIRYDNDRFAATMSTSKVPANIGL